MDFISQREFYDPVTKKTVKGIEIYDAVLQERVKSGHARFEWYKIFPRLFATFVKAINTPALRIIDRIVSRINKSTNEFKGSYSDIAKSADASVMTVNRIMKALQVEDFLRPSGYCNWMINPTMLYAGSDEKNFYLREQYFGLQCKWQPANEVTPEEKDVQTDTGDELSDFQRRLHQLDERSEENDSETNDL